MDFDVDDDDAILLDRALNGVCYEDLKYLMREFGEEPPPAETERQPSSRYLRYFESEQQSGNATTTSEGVEFISSQTSGFKQESPSESSIDERQENEPSPDSDNSGYERSKCAGCDNPKQYTKIYGIYLCSSCMKFIAIMARKNFKTICITGQGNCRATYSNGDPIRCQSCRLRNIIRLDIKHPAWVRYKTIRGIDSNISEHSMLQADELGSDDGSDDQKSMRTDNDSSSSDSSSKSSEHEQDESAAPSNHDQCGSKRFKCVSCGAPNHLKRYGMNLCSACQGFIIKVARKKFKVYCDVGLGACRVTYKFGHRMRCASCRLENMMKLDIRHPAWVRYKRKKGHKIANSQMPDRRQVGASRSKEQHISDDDADRESISSSSSEQSSSSEYARKSSSDSSCNERKRSKTASSRGQSGCERNKCIGCDVPNSHKLYGLNLCSGCRAFIFNIAKKNFEVVCLGGQSNCRTTRDARTKLSCSYCRLKKLMKFDIRHPEWVRYKAERGIRSGTPQDDELHSQDTEDREIVSLTGETSCDIQYISQKPCIDGRRRSLASASDGQSRLKRINCDGCNNPTIYDRIHGVNLCGDCRSFTYFMPQKNFKVSCIGRRDNCRTTYRPGCLIRCHSCRLKKFLKLDIRHPAWVSYRAKHRIGSETLHDPAQPDRESYLNDDDVDDDDDDDDDRESLSSHYDNPGDQEYSNQEPSVDCQRGSIGKSSSHDQSGAEQLKCASCSAPSRSTYYGVNMCSACRVSAFNIAKKKFKAICITGEDNCRTTHKVGRRIRCPSCRLKKLMKLDIRHPAWIEFRAKNGYQIITSQQDGANLLNHSLESKDDDFEDEAAASTSQSIPGGEENIDELDRRIASPNLSKSRFGGYKCASCGNPNEFVKIYGINLCTCCRKFIGLMVTKNFKTTCITGLGTCQTTYSDGEPIRCQSCKLRNMIKLNIRNPVWVRYKAKRGIESKTSLDDELYSEDNDDDEIISVASGNYSSQNPCIDGQKRSSASASDDQSRLERINCDGCNNPKIYERIYGLNLCCGCRQFTVHVRRKNFKVTCTGGLNQCRTTYSPGSHITCQSCRLKKFMTLNIQHHAWESYRAEHWIESESPRDPAQHDEEPHLDEESMLSSVDNPGDQEYSDQESNVDCQRGSIGKSSNHDQSGAEQLKCASCSAPSRSTYYGVNMCSACRVFAFKISKKEFRAICITGRDNCRTTYKKGSRIECPSCRLKKFMKLDIRHPAWIQYKKTHKFNMSDNMARQDNANLSDEPQDTSVLEDGEVKARHSNSSGEQYSNRMSSNNGRDGCVGCDAPNKYKRFGLDLCQACQLFINYVADKATFQAPCRRGQGNCRTTYIAGNRMKCPACRIRRLMKLDVRHPAWIKYKAKHGVKSETLDNSAPQADPNDEDDDDQFIDSMASSRDSPGIEAVDEDTVRVASKSLIEPGEDCDADDEIELMEIDCD